MRRLYIILIILVILIAIFSKRVLPADSDIFNIKGITVWMEYEEDGSITYHIYGEKNNKYSIVNKNSEKFQEEKKLMLCDRANFRTYNELLFKIQEITTANELFNILNILKEEKWCLNVEMLGWNCLKRFMEVQDASYNMAIYPNMVYWVTHAAEIMTTGYLASELRAVTKFVNEKQPAKKGPLRNFLKELRYGNTIKWARDKCREDTFIFGEDFLQLYWRGEESRFNGYGPRP